MGIAKKQKRKKAYQYHKNRKRQYQKLKRNPPIPDDIIRENWQKHQSATTNLNKLGLAYKVNNDFDKKNASVVDQTAIKKLEAVAGIRNETKVVISVVDAEECEYYINKYGENYTSMSRDAKNVEQATAKQLRKRIKRYFDSEYYLKKQQSSTSTNEENEPMEN